ncbi:MAG: L-aspartate oxidase, partial [Desulfobacterales bacterium]|nr:L-aspartate oxidase [Desulfobacterales bacterium]
MEIEADFFIIGSGIAGLSFALKVADFGQVVMVTKKEAIESNTNRAQGGIASVFGSLDSFDLHIRDTLAAGDGLCHQDVVDMVVKDGPDRIRELISLGVKFNVKREKDTHGSFMPGDADFDLGREGGHSQNRIVHAHDMTGKEVESILLSRVKNHKNIKLLENNIAIDLITFSTRMKSEQITTTHEHYCCGAYVLDRETNQVKTIRAQITLLATGGAGKVYLYTSNPDIATGDGIAMAYRAGASVANLEFVQFHPTCLYHPDAKNFLISEVVRGEGGILLTASGERFMERYDPQKDLACRDVVARAIDTELKKSGDDSVYLDISHKASDFIKERFPNLYEKSLEYGFDMTTDPLPVVPAAHYMCGGVVTDMEGRTDINRLYAVGETACTGLHGANRLASNSLLEALVYADKTAKAAIAEIQSAGKINVPTVTAWDDTGTTDSDELVTVSQNWDE